MLILKNVWSDTTLITQCIQFMLFWFHSLMSTGY